MALTYGGQRKLRSSLPTLVMSPARSAGIPDGGDAVNWLLLNIPLMAVFFIAMTGIPLWLVWKHPDHEPAAGSPATSRQARPTTAGRQPAVRRQPMAVPAQPVPVYLPSNRDRYAQVGR
jgi:hypothetical protein